MEVLDKRTDNLPETNLNEMKVSDLPDRKFKIMGIKMLIDVRKSMHD